MMGEVGTKEEKPNKNKNFLAIVRVCPLRMIGGRNELLLPVSSSRAPERAPPPSGKQQRNHRSFLLHQHVVRAAGRSEFHALQRDAAYLGEAGHLVQRRIQRRHQLALVQDRPGALASRPTWSARGRPCIRGQRALRVPPANLLDFS